MPDPKQLVEVALAFKQAGFEHGCKNCFTTHVRGKYAITLTMEDKTFFVCNPKPSTCCDEEKHWMILYNYEAAAEIALAAINQQIEQTGNIDGIHLLLPATSMKVAEA